MQVLADSLKSDHHHILSCIKYEVLGERPIYDSFKTFCKRIGDDFMGFQEFEFWYMRFYNGDVDMDYDRKKDPKPLELMQLPVEVVGKLVEKLDLPSRLFTRNVCKTLQTVVDGTKKKFKSLRFYESLGGCPNLFLDNQQIFYMQNNDKLGTKIRHREHEFQTKRGSTVDFAISDLKTVIKGHNMELDSLEICDFTEDGHLVEKALSVFKEKSTALKSQFTVKKARIWFAHPELIVPCLSLLTPGILEDLEVNDISDEILNTDQWLLAKIGRFMPWRAMNPRGIEIFWHFEEFYTCIGEISAEIMVQLKETLVTFPSLKKCEIKFSSYLPFTINVAAAALGLPVQNGGEVHVPIPRSNDVLVIAFETDRTGPMHIERRHA